MDRFKASSGLIHYLFANDDVYYTDSMIRLNLQDYLYYELKAERYEYVFSISGQRGKYYVNLYDDASYALAMRQIKRIFERISEEFDGKPIEATDDRVRKLVRNASNSAFVFRLHTFCSIFNGNNYEVNRLMTELSANGNIIILRMDSSADHSLPYLMDEKGILRGKFGGRLLFPEIVESFNKEQLKSGTAYRSLEMKAGDRCTCYNSFTIGAIRRVINYVMWFRLKKESDYSEYDLEKIVKFIYTWYRCTDMRLKYPDCLSDNPEHSYRILSKDIEKRWPTIVENTSDWNEKYTKEDISQEIHVTEDTDIIAGLRGIKFGEEYTGKPDCETMKRDWMHLCREYSKPHGEMIPENVADILKYTVGVMDTAVRKQDSETIKLCMDCLNNAIKKKFENDEKALKRWKAYRNVIEISQDHFALRETIESENASIKKWNTDLDEMIQLIDQMEHRHTPEPEKDYHKNRAINLRNRINDHQDFVHQRIAKFKTFADLQNSLEIMIASDNQYNVQEFQDIIESSSSYIEDFKEDSLKLKQSTECVESSIDDLDFSPGKKDIDSEYQEMLKLMEAANNAFNETEESEIPDDLEDLVLL